jgi:hypothetical protein
LNMQARSLESLGRKIGGLLGDDGHADVSTPPSGCKFSGLMARGRSPSSRASASMTMFE